MAPAAVNVVWAPAQINVGLALAVTVGFGLTVNDTVDELTQFALLPLTV